VAVAIFISQQKSVPLSEAFSNCESYPKRSDAILDCWYQVLHEYHNAGGVAAAFVAFDYLYENKVYFAETGCHLHAHRIGDFAFFDSFLIHHDLDKLSFPEGSQVCGYGFYHGFIEHLIQDNPSPQYVREVCDYMDKRLSGMMPLIRITCFHGSGHGFALAEVDEGDITIWGDYEKIINVPLQLCGELQAEESEISECYEGVFNVLVSWMETGEYGLSYNYQDPFWICVNQHTEYKWPCYYEVGQKLDFASQYSVKNAVAIVSQISDEGYDQRLLQLAVGNFLQSRNSATAHIEYLSDCFEIEDRYLPSCVQGLVAGVVEHGNPGDEQKKAVEICSHELVGGYIQRGCYEEVFGRLTKLYPKTRVTALCNQSLSESFTESCIEKGYISL